jgi:hypothetical protein
MGVQGAAAWTMPKFAPKPTKFLKTACSALRDASLGTGLKAIESKPGSAAEDGDGWGRPVTATHTHQ